MVCLMIDRVFSRVQPPPQAMVVQSLWHQADYFQVNSLETSCLNLVQSVVQALNNLPDFAHNLTLSDELRDRQTGIITKGDGCTTQSLNRYLAI
jgi:hypothetical protein